MNARIARQLTRTLTEADQARHALLADLKSSLSMLKGALARADEGTELHARLYSDVAAISSFITGLEMSLGTIAHAVGTAAELHEAACAAEDWG